jgi:hypothetical protein
MKYLVYCQNEDKIIFKSPKLEEAKSKASEHYRSWGHKAEIYTQTLSTEEIAKNFDDEK